jgi:hypothetical protein
MKNYQVRTQNAFVREQIAIHVSPLRSNWWRSQDIMACVVQRSTDKKGRHARGYLARMTKTPAKRCGELSIHHVDPGASHLIYVLTNNLILFKLFLFGSVYFVCEDFSL